MDLGLEPVRSETHADVQFIIVLRDVQEEWIL
jgi:hypothetical protein